MKKILFLVLALLLSLAACSAGASIVPSSSPAVSEAQTPSAKTSVSPTASATELPAVSPSPPSPSGFVADVIPDLTGKSGFKYNSSDSFYEDDKYFIYEDCESLNIYYKDSGACKLITDSCNGATLYGGKVYFIYLDPSKPDFIIKKYDPSDGSIKNLIRLKNDTLAIAVYKNRIYYTYCYNTSEEDDYDIFSVDLNGKNKSRIGLESAQNFYFRGNEVYYTFPEDGSSIYVYNLKTDAEDQFSYTFAPKDEFDIAGDKLYYLDDSLESVDLATGKLSAIINNADSYAFLGQYILYLSAAENDSFLDAYDISTQKTYKLILLGTSSCQLYTTPDNAYIDIYQASENTDILYSIVISGGKASLEKAADFSANSNQ